MCKSHSYIVAFFFLEFETVCRREINTTSGWLVPLSSDHFKLSEATRDCSYLLRAESGKVIELKFSTVYITWTAVCYNYFQVRNPVSIKRLSSYEG